MEIPSRFITAHVSVSCVSAAENTAADQVSHIFTQFHTLSSLTLLIGCVLSLLFYS